MQQHHASIRGGTAQLRGGSTPIRPQQFPQQNPSNFQQQPVGNRTPQSGTTAQTAGFINDGSFSPATGHSQAGMPYKSAGGFQQQQISSTTSNQELSESFTFFQNSQQIVSE